MKKLNLSNKDRKHLLQMIKVLFPEIYSKDINRLDIRDGDDETPCIMHNDGKNWDIIIHWYEFCIRQLPERLFDRLVANEIYEEDEHDDWWYDDMSWIDNPVDYFYNEFKKLK